uniref:Hemolysin activation/secretion protein n=1 Tax=Candidatus Kentrum sp. TC TaxID=2126339 RepID=A0A450YE21_9GAMM|nr:MAG: Hemolysin activation/secretion protein [Candidatus Kentron sp. TC]VFK48291.1 MAG: Hemolysin activation/secretion protein [Candidatus Kentron sp. TC]
MFLRFVVILLLFLVPTISFSEDADQLEKRFEPKEKPKSEIAPLLPKVAQVLPAGKSFRENFELKVMKIVGSTVYANQDLEALYASYLRPPATSKLFQDLTKEIARKYEADGYPYTQVSVEPPNSPGGALRVVIREAYIDNVVITGEVKDKKGLFTRLVERIKSMRPVYKPDFERYLLLANDLAGVHKVEAKIDVSEKVPGAHTLTLEITPGKTTSGFFSIDNRGTDAVGPSTIIPGIFISNPFGYFSKTSILLATTAETKELRFISAGYELPINDEGAVLEIKGTYNKSYPGTATAEALDAYSRSQTLSLGISYPFIRTQQKNFTGYGKFDIKYADTGNQTGKLTEDEMRVFRAGGNFDYADSTNAITQLQIEWSHGLSGLGATSNNSITKSRSDGVVDFDKVAYSFSRTQPLSFISPKLDKWTAYGAIEGQLASDGLLSGEECGIGGQYFGRAYDTSEITGERCISASAELRRSIDTSRSDLLTSTEGYLFYDIGKAKHRNPTSTPQEASLSSAGIGLEFQTSKNVTLSVELAKPLTKKVTNENDKDLRIFGNLVMIF